MSAMTWSETRRRQDVLREVKAIAAVRQDGVLPWSDDYADAYATPDELLRDLQYFWRITVEAQMDTKMGAAALEERWDAIHRAYPGVLPILESNYSRSPLMRAHELKEAIAELVA
jgi:hypothetical protein